VTLWGRGRRGGGATGLRRDRDRPDGLAGSKRGEKGVNTPQLSRREL